MKKILYFLLPLLLMTACHKNSYVARVTDVRLVSVDPKNGYPGDLVTLLGNNFSTDPEKNIVMLDVAKNAALVSAVDGERRGG